MKEERARRESGVVEKTSWLYHGSQERLQRLDPRTGRCLLAEKNRQYAIYASPYRHYAVPFALTIAPDEEGVCEWHHVWHHAECRPTILIRAGHLDLSRLGYLYRCPAQTFQPLDPYQWVSYEPVVPRDYRVIDPRDYVGWVEYAAGPAAAGVFLSGEP